MIYRSWVNAMIILSLVLLQFEPPAPAYANTADTETHELQWTSFYGPLKDEDFHSTNYAYGNGVYVAAEGYSSKNGINWTKIPALEHVLKTSKNGKDWTELNGFGSLTSKHYGSTSHLNILYR